MLLAPHRPYVPRTPERTPLYTVVREDLSTFLEERRAESGGVGLPRHVEQAFEAYLDCGILANGFARVRCPDCAHEKLVAFSCKGRLCPSCNGRRMHDTAAHLVDRLLPPLPHCACNPR